jgi:hypothetical protein
VRINISDLQTPSTPENEQPGNHLKRLKEHESQILMQHGAKIYNYLKSPKSSNSTA